MMEALDVYAIPSARPSRRGAWGTLARARTGGTRALTPHEGGGGLLAGLCFIGAFKVFEVLYGERRPPPAARWPTACAATVSPRAASRHSAGAGTEAGRLALGYCIGRCVCVCVWLQPRFASLTRHADR